MIFFSFGVTTMDMHEYTMNIDDADSMKKKQY